MQGRKGRGRGPFANAQIENEEVVINVNTFEILN